MSLAEQPGQEKETYDDGQDETIAERLMGLTEMLPASVRTTACTVASISVKSCKGLFSFSCNAAWVFFTTAIIAFAPIVLETERVTMEDIQKSQQTHVLLGPRSAMAATASGPSPHLSLIR